MNDKEKPLRPASRAARPQIPEVVAETYRRCRWRFRSSEARRNRRRSGLALDCVPETGFNAETDKADQRRELSMRVALRSPRECRATIVWSSLASVILQRVAMCTDGREDPITGEELLPCRCGAGSPKCSSHFVPPDARISIGHGYP